MTACAPLCAPPDEQRVTSRPLPQPRLCQNRVTVVRPPVSSAPPKTAGEPGGRKKCRIKAGGRFAPPCRRTPPRRAGRGFSLGGRFDPLLAVAGGRKEGKQRRSRYVPAFFKVHPAGGSRGFWQGSARGHVSPPGGKLGVAPAAIPILAEFRRGYPQILRRLNKVRNPRP